MSLVQIDTEMAEKYTKQQPAVCGKFAFGRYAAGCVSALMALVTLIFDLLTLKLVCKSHLRWVTLSLNLGMLGLWILKLFAIYTTDRWLDRQTEGQKQRLLPSSYDV